MKRAQRRTTKKKVIRSWTQARVLLEGWRKKLTTVQVELRRPRIIDVAPVDLLRDEPVERAGRPVTKFRAQVIYLTRADVTVRRPSGALLVIDNYEIAALADRKTRFQPR
ncbi:MAG: hypothetical protein ACE5IP_04560 [Terriglobia bacterium]